MSIGVRWSAVLCLAVLALPACDSSDDAVPVGSTAVVVADVVSDATVATMDRDRVIEVERQLDEIEALLGGLDVELAAD